MGSSRGDHRRIRLSLAPLSRPGLATPISTLGASIAAIAIGGSPGAVIGALLARRVARQHREYYADQVRHGGILLWVRVTDTERSGLRPRS